MTLDQQSNKRGSGDDRRLAIARAAGAIIAEKGLEGLRMRDIAGRVGINIATLHYHVPSKEALIALVADSIRVRFREQGMAHSRAGKNALEQLRMEFVDFRETANEMPDLVIILTELVERSRRDAAVAQIMMPLQDFWRNQFVDIFRLGLTDGSFRASLDPQAAALITTGALFDFWRQSTANRAALEPLLAELERAFIALPQG